MQLNCPRCQGNQFTQHQTFKTFPPYLIMPVSRFVTENWVPKKLNAMIAVDELLDLARFREPAADPDLLITDQKVSQAPKYTMDAVNQIVEFGFSANAAKRALAACGNNVEAATNWIMTNMDDPSIDAPFEEVEKS